MEDIEKGVETTELWVERLRIAAVEHYSKHHVPQDLLVQKKTADYLVKQMQQQAHSGGSVTSNNEEDLEEDLLDSCDSKTELTTSQANANKLRVSVSLSLNWIWILDALHSLGIWQIIVKFNGDFDKSSQFLIGH